jgi:acyl carrier protein
MTNPNEAIRERIRNILKDCCLIIIDSENSEQNIHLDSMALMGLIVGLENEFNFTLDDRAMEVFYRPANLDSITQLVTEKVST